MNRSLRLPLVMQQVSVRAIVYMTLSALCFSVVELAGRYFVHGISAYQLVWGRYVVHLLFMLTVLGPRYRTTLVQSKRMKLQIIRSLTMLAMPVCFLLASMSMPAHDVWAIYWLSPLIMLTLSTWVLHEPASSRQWLAAIVGFGGILLVLRPDRGIFSPAALLALGVGVSISLHLTLSRVLRHDHPLTSLFHTALWVFATISLVMPFVWQTPSWSDLIGVVIVGIVGMLGLFVLARSSELAPIPVVASFAYTEVFWTLLLNVLLLGIMPTKSELLGALVIGGVTVFLLLHQTSEPVSIAPQS